MNVKEYNCPDLHRPRRLLSEGDVLLEKVRGNIRDGNRLLKSCEMAGLPGRTFRDWRAFAREESEAGFEGTVCQWFVGEVERELARAEGRLLPIVYQQALDGDFKSQEFMLRNVYGVSKSDLIAVDDDESDSVVSINIVPKSKPDYLEGEE